MEELLNHPRGDAAGDEKESLPPVNKEQENEMERRRERQQLAALAKEEKKILEEMLRRSIMSEEDDALEDVSEWLRCACRKGTNLEEGNKWFKYLKLIVESEGFDMDIDDLPVAELPFVPMLKLNPELDVLAKHALNQFNQKKGPNYEFVKVEKANGRLWGPGANLYITFQALRENSDSADALRTFQALVFSGVDPKYYVKVCRPKAGAN